MNETMRDEHERQIHASPWTDNPLGSKLERIIVYIYEHYHLHSDLLLIVIAYVAYASSSTIK